MFECCSEVIGVSEPKVLKREDLGVVKFGVFRGKPWSAVSEDYLKYLISDDCNTAVENKELAKKELSQRCFLDGQMELF